MYLFLDYLFNAWFGIGETCLVWFLLMAEPKREKINGPIEEREWNKRANIM